MFWILTLCTELNANDVLIINYTVRRSSIAILKNTLTRCNRQSPASSRLSGTVRLEFHWARGWDQVYFFVSCRRSPLQSATFEYTCGLGQKPGQTADFWKPARTEAQKRTCPGKPGHMVTLRMLQYIPYREPKVIHTCHTSVLYTCHWRQSLQQSSDSQWDQGLQRMAVGLPDQFQQLPAPQSTDQNCIRQHNGRV